MIYIEMRRERAASNDAWGFKKLVWAPAKRADGATWPFWSKILQLREGDIIFHLYGIPPRAYFVGYSIVAQDGVETRERPANPGQWASFDSFLRAEIKDFTPFEAPINLSDIFSFRRAELDSYFLWNKSRRAEKANIFFVKQSGRLQCLNGAYLSDADDKLLTALFGAGNETITSQDGKVLLNVKTGMQITTIKQRVGQQQFSYKIKELYGNKCCFPDCDVSDSRFLIGAHIARWSDNEDLRGHLGNGLCLCLMHDKAFELGLFTIDDNFRVLITQNTGKYPSVTSKLITGHQKEIAFFKVRPLKESLMEHRKRVHS